MTDDGLDLKEAARRLDVHYQTAYRWVREGRLAARRVRNRYVLDPDDVEAMIRELSTPTDPQPTVTRRDWPGLGARFLDHLLTGDERRVRATVERLHAQGEPAVRILSELFVPALVEIGVGWRDGRISIAQEHRASAILTRALAVIDRQRPGRPRGTAVVVSPAGDRHDLPAAMAATVLRGDGWHVHHLGPDLPAASFAAFLADDVDADLAVITVTNPESAEHAEALAEVARRAGVEAVVGGPGRTLDELVDEARAAA